MHAIFVNGVKVMALILQVFNSMKAETAGKPRIKQVE
jgi:hypothetical protein